MKIAFCFSGQLRTAEHAAEGILRFVGDMLPNVDFFVHTWGKNQHRIRSYQSIKIYEIAKALGLTENLKQLDKKIMLPYKTPSTYEVLKKITPIYKFESIEIENYDNCVHKFPKLYRHLQPHMYAWYKVNELKKLHEQTYNFKYDYVIRTRPDMLFPKETSLSAEIENCEKFPGAFFGQGGLPNRLNDVFYMSKSETMDIAAQWMVNNPDRLCISDFMAMHNIKSYNTVLKPCAIYRPECIPISSLNYEECYNIDRNWYWTKNDTFRFNIARS